MRLGALSGSVVIPNSPNAITLPVPLVALPPAGGTITDFGQIETAWINAGMPFSGFFNIPGIGQFQADVHANQNQRTSIQNGTEAGDSIQAPGDGGYVGGVTLNSVSNGYTKQTLWPTQTGPNSWTGKIYVGTNEGMGLNAFDYGVLAVLAVAGGAMAGAIAGGSAAAGAGTATGETVGEGAPALTSEDATAIYSDTGYTGETATTSGSGIGSGASVSTTTTATSTSATDTLPGDAITANGSPVQIPDTVDTTSSVQLDTGNMPTSIDNFTPQEPQPIDVTPQNVDILTSDDQAAIDAGSGVSASSGLPTLQQASSGLSLARMIGNAIAVLTGKNPLTTTSSDTNPGGDIADTASGSIGGLALMALAAYLLFEG